MADWIIIVDNDIDNLKYAGEILTKAGKRVTALKNGSKLFSYIRENGIPDLILMDINIPDLDGFEAIKLLKKELPPGQEIPVIFSTANEHQALEIRGLASGAMDFIKKPYDPEVLVSRVQRILDIQNRIRKYERDAETDPLTGFLNKTAAAAKIALLCQTEPGFLCAIDLDSFKSINDIFGHDIGDRVLIMFADVLHKSMMPGWECGRIGGDEFIVFAAGMAEEAELLDFTDKLNSDYIAGAKKLMGDHLPIPLGISIGASATPEFGRDYTKLFHLADQALYFVKQNGRHGCRLYRQMSADETQAHRYLDLETVTAILEERNASPNAMWMGNEMFGSIYRYMVRYMDRYHSIAYRVLFSVKPTIDITEVENTELMMQFRKMMQQSLRNSDVMMECGENQLFLLLPEVQEYDIDHVLARLLNKWRHSDYADKAEVTYEAGQVHLKKHHEQKVVDVEKATVAVLEGNEKTRNLVQFILNQENLNVMAFESTEQMLRAIAMEKPELILLEVHLPVLEGLTALERIRKEIDPEREIPIIMLAGETDLQTETRCMELGAVDIIRKPFVPDLLVSRVNQSIELVSLQKNLASAVQRKTKGSGDLMLEIVRSIMDAIDTRDINTRGHSDRVAKYAKEIGRRYGYTVTQQEDLYLMALLHDTGRFSIPEAVVNKSGKLTEEELALIREHPVVGGNILIGIEELPYLYTGARWHHERYDGKGYPDGLAGEEIPEEARIIAVADAYDAMTSSRTYRDPLTQVQVREEIRNCSGSQFDPKFAEIMLGIIDDDKDFVLRDI